MVGQVCYKNGYPMYYVLNTYMYLCINAYFIPYKGLSVTFEHWRKYIAGPPLRAKDTAKQGMQMETSKIVVLFFK